MNRLLFEASRLSPYDVCAEILALSVVEHTYTPSLHIAIDLKPSSGTLFDSGRGMAIVPDRGDTISHAERALTSIYPCVSAHPHIDAILTELVWGERGPLGPALPNAACLAYQFTSERGGEMWSQRFASGAPLGPPAIIGSTERTGTTIAFETSGPIDHHAFNQLVRKLNERIPSLPITLRTA